jgi:hypothetical protein
MGGEADDRVLDVNKDVCLQRRQRTDHIRSTILETRGMMLSGLLVRTAVNVFRKMRLEISFFMGYH